MDTMRDQFLRSGDEPAAAAVVTADGPIVVFGGSDSNVEPTKAFCAAAMRAAIAPERIICTGNVVAYGADAHATVALVREAGVHVVMGNCEEPLSWRLQGCGCGFAEGTPCDRAAREWYRHADSQLDAFDRKWMRALPRQIDGFIGSHRLAVVHGGIDRSNAFLFASTPKDEIRRQITLAGCHGVIAGHCGLPFTRIVDGRLWHNAGAFGMPANDGTLRTWFSLIEPCRGGGARIRHLPLDYDFAATAAKMRAARLPEGYAVSLESGLWPSCDVLPLAELAHRGAPIPETVTLWPAQPPPCSPWRDRAPRRRSHIHPRQASEQAVPVDHRFPCRER